MRLSIQQTSLGSLNAHDAWRLPKQVGLEGLNVCYPGEEDILALYSLDHVIELADMACQYELPISGMHLGYLGQGSFLAGEQNHREVAKRIVRQALSVASQIGAPAVIVPLDGANGGSSRQHDEAVAQDLQEMADDTPDAAVVIAIEGPLAIDRIETLLARADRPRVKFCFDTGNAAAGRLDAIETIRHLGVERIAQVHFRDVNLSVQPPDFSIRLGHGDVQFDAVVSALRSVRYDGWIVLKMPPGDTDGRILALHVEDARRILSPGVDRERPHGDEVECPAS